MGGRSLRDGFRGSGALLGVLACLAILLAAGCSGSDSYQEQAEAPTNQPNIIFVLTDDLDYASAYRMPSINSLLREQGADFDSAFVSYPLCCPSRATILTGLYAHNHGVNGNNPPDGGFPKFRSEGLEAKTIAVRLQQSGYRTAFFGKYLNHYPGDAPATYVTPGWDEWYLKRNANKMYDYRISENGKIVSYGSETEDYYTDVLSDQATDFIRRTASGCKPFFMYVAPTAPHLPADPAERHKDAFAGESPPRPLSFDEQDVSDKPSQIRNSSHLSDADISTINYFYQERLSSMLAVDEMVASLVSELEAAGVLDNTFIFFTSDNGWMQGEHLAKKRESPSHTKSPFACPSSCGVLECPPDRR